MDLVTLERMAASPLGQFRPWVTPEGVSPQREFLQSAGAPNRIFRAGNQCGKTTISCFDLLLDLSGWHPYSRHKPPMKAWWSSLDWEWGIGQVTWPTMRPMMPWDEIKTIRYARKTAAREIPDVIIWKNGSELSFKSAATGRGKYQGAPLHRVHLDEEHPGDIVEECGARLVRHGGSLTASLTPVLRAKWVMDLEQQASTVVVRAAMSDAAKAGILDLSAVETYLSGLPERQRAVRDYGDFSQLEGLVYPEYNDASHIARPRAGELHLNGRNIAPWPLPEHWPRYASIDFGYANPCAVILTAMDPRTRRLFVYQVLYQREVRIAVWCELLRRHLPDMLGAPVISDHDLVERMELQAGGIPTTPATKDVITGIEAVQRRLMPMKDGAPGIVFVKHESGYPHDPIVGRMDAHWLCWELSGYRYPKPTDKPGRPDVRDAPVKRDDHAADSLRYLIMALDGGPGPIDLSSAAHFGAPRAGH